jgi:hypothetical protein
MAKRVFGTLVVWVASQSGGYGFIDDAGGTRTVNTNTVIYDRVSSSVN